MTTSKSFVRTNAVGGKSLAPYRLVEEFLNINKVCIYEKSIYIFNSKTGLWEKTTIAELVQLTGQMLSKEEKRLWNPRIKNEVDAKLNISINTCHFNDEWLKNRFPLNNGVLNLKNGKVYKYSDKYFFTSKTEYDFDSSADCPLFNQFLKTVCSGNQKQVLMLEELLGYLLTSHNIIQYVFYLYGNGKNGKSVFLEIAKELIGRNYFFTSTLEQLDNPFTRANLVGKKVLFIGDLSKKDSSNFITAEIKKLCGGDDISAEKKYGDSFSITDSAVRVVASSNFFPVCANDSSFGAARRIFLIPFEHTVKHADLHLSSKLKKELPGILNVAINGLKRLQKNNYNFSFNGAGEYQNRMLKMYPIRYFVMECIQPVPYSFVKYVDIQLAYKEWCLKNSIIYKMPDSNKFLKEIQLAYSNVERIKSNGERGIDNIQLI